jgi:hypothetical protein
MRSSNAQALLFLAITLSGGIIASALTGAKSDDNEILAVSSVRIDIADYSIEEIVIERKNYSMTYYTLGDRRMNLINPDNCISGEGISETPFTNCLPFDRRLGTEEGIDGKTFWGFQGDSLYPFMLDPTYISIPTVYP